MLKTVTVDNGNAIQAKFHFSSQSVCTYVCICMYVCVCVCMHVCMYVCMYVRMYVCKYHIAQKFDSGNL